MNETMELIAESIAEDVLDERNIWKALPPSEKATYRKAAANAVRTLLVNKSMFAKPQKELPPDPNDPTPVTMQQVIDAVCRTLGVTREEMTTSKARDRTALHIAIYLCRKLVVPRPRHLDIAREFDLSSDCVVVNIINKFAESPKKVHFARLCQQELYVPTQRPVPSDTEGRVGEGSMRDCERETLAGL